MAVPCLRVVGCLVFQIAAPAFDGHGHVSALVMQKCSRISTYVKSLTMQQICRRQLSSILRTSV